VESAAGNPAMNIEHRTLNAERPIRMMLRSIYFNKQGPG
jgi:hypothetical protein